MSDTDEDHRATYNEHDSSKHIQDNPTNALHALAANVPVTKPDENVRERIINADNQAMQRSEDIRPVPPTIQLTRPSTNTVRGQNHGDTSPVRGSTSGDITESDEDESSAAAYNQPPEPTPANPPNVPQTPTRLPGTPAGQNPPPTSRPNPDNSTRQPGGAGPNSNRKISLFLSSHSFCQFLCSSFYSTRPTKCRE